MIILNNQVNITKSSTKFSSHLIKNKRRNNVLKINPKLTPS